MTKYEDMTVDYLAAQMEAMGLEPAFDGSWYQPFEMIAAAKQPGFKSFVLKAKGDVVMDVSYDIKQTRNVGGMIRGTEHPDEVVVLSAHWDHLGFGPADETGDDWDLTGTLANVNLILSVAISLANCD